MSPSKIPVIYFNTRTDIRKINADGRIAAVYQPELPAGQLIFGFTVRGSRLCYALQESPNLAGKQEIETYDITEETVLLPITGIAAEDIDTVYDGNLKRIAVTGILEGDTVTYKFKGNYGPEQPEPFSQENPSGNSIWLKMLPLFPLKSASTKRSGNTASAFRIITLAKP